MKKLLSILLLLLPVFAWAAYPIIGTPKPQFFDTNGDPLASGTLQVLNPADDTNKTYYPTADDADALTNGASGDITLDSRGETPNGFFGPNGVGYKLVLKDSLGVTIWTQDDIRVPGGQTVVSVLDHGAVCDGTTDDTTAFNSALADDRHVYIPPGTCLVGNIDESDLDNVRITGAGAGITTVKLKDSEDDGVFHFHTTPSNLIIEHFTIDGNAANQTARDGVQGEEGIWIQGAQGAQGSDITIQHMEIFNTSGGAIRVTDSSDIVIDNISGYGAGSRPIYVHASVSGTPGTDDIYRVRITNNEYDWTTQTAVFDLPILWVGGEATTGASEVKGRDIVVSNNIFTQKIVTASDSPGSVGCIVGQQREEYTITGNTCRNGGNGISHGNNSNYGIIANNIVEVDATSDFSNGAATNYGIEIGRFSTKTAVWGNVIRGNGVLAKGIQAQRGTSDINISNNTVFDIEDTGIEINNAGCEYTISGASIANPSVITTSTASNYPSGQLIYIADIGASESDVSDGFYLTGSTVTSTTFTLLNLDGTNFNNTVESTPSGTVECQVEHVSITGNVIDGDTEEGMVIDDSHHWSVTGNTIDSKGAGTSAIKLTGTTNDGSITGNTIDDIQTDFVHMTQARVGAADAHVIDNIVIVGNSLNALSADTSYLKDSLDAGASFGTGLVYANNSQGTYVQALTGAGAIVPSSSQVELTPSSDPIAYTLADGAEGARVVLINLSASNDAEITPANYSNGTKVDLPAQNDVAVLEFFNGSWYTMYLDGTATEI